MNAFHAGTPCLAFFTVSSPLSSVSQSAPVDPRTSRSSYCAINSPPCTESSTDLSCAMTTPIGPGIDEGRDRVGVVHVVGHRLDTVGRAGCERCE
jgi:hypothetical protein